MECDALRRAAADLRLAAAECRKAAKACRERAQRAGRRRDTSAWSARRQDEALVVYLLADGSLEAAVEYLEQVSSPHKAFDEHSRRALSEQVQSWFLARPMPELKALLEPATPSGRARAAAARRFVAERGVAQWVRTANVDKGLAPPSRHLHAVLDACFRDHETVLGLAAPPLAAGRSLHAQRKWAFRWRKRWGAKFGKVRPRDDMTREQMVDKAGRSKHAQVGPWAAVPADCPGSSDFGSRTSLC
jgi:hypothetical protein